MGYDPEFLTDCTIPLPSLGTVPSREAFNGGVPLDHERFSIIFNEDRALAIVTGHNIAGESIIPAGMIPRRNDFRPDPDLTEGLQIDNRRGYSGGNANPWDRGHLVRRRSLHWGDVDQARKADSQSFFWTNIAPQHRRLNQGAWGKIEDWMMDFADQADQHAAIFTGPVFTDEDPKLQNSPEEVPIRIPSGFWKIMAIKCAGEVRAAGFLTWQLDFGREDPVDFDPVLEQVRMTTIEFLTGLSFGDLRDADPLRVGAAVTANHVVGGGARSGVQSAGDLVV